MIEILAPDLTPLDGVEIPHLEAGQDSGSVPFVLRNTGPDVADVLVVLQVLDQVSSQWLSSGLPPLDELWLRLRITGQDTANAPAQQLEVHDWTPVGTGRSLHLATLLSGGLRTGEIRFHPPATAARLTWQFRLAVIASEHAYPVPPEPARASSLAWATTATAPSSAASRSPPPPPPPIASTWPPASSSTAAASSAWSRPPSSSTSSTAPARPSRRASSTTPSLVLLCQTEVRHAPLVVERSNLGVGA